MITVDEEVLRQALEALIWEVGSEPTLYAAQTAKAIKALRAALAEPEQEQEWLTGCPSCGMDGGCDCDEGTYNPPQRPAEPVQEPQCNPHPNAPHGFLRNASHTEGRYVCACEYWQPYEAALEQPNRAQRMRDAGYTRRPTMREMAEPVLSPAPGYCKHCKQYTIEEPLPAEPEQEPVAWRTFDGEGGYDYRTYDDNENYRDEWDKRNPNHKGWVEPLYTHPPRREPPLTEEEIRDLWSWSATAEAERTATTQQHAFARSIENKLKEKNT